MIDFVNNVELQLQNHVRMIHSDNGTEFENQVFEKFLTNKDVSHNFSSLYTPQQNGVIERRNHSLCEAARTTLIFANLPIYFWDDVIGTTCFYSKQILH